MTDDEIFKRWNWFSITLDEEVSRLFVGVELDSDDEDRVEELKDEFRDELWRLFHPEDEEDDDKPADLRIYKEK